MKYDEHTKQWVSPYWHPAVTTDAVVFGFDGVELNVLLIQRGLEPYMNMWALPGGFMRPEDESAAACAYRELREETDVDDIYMEEMQTFSQRTRDPRERVITIAFFALVVKNKYHVKGGDDASNAKWFPVKELPELAFDHKEIIELALERLRQRIHFEPIGFDLLDDTFTIPDLQRLYEIILGTKFDRRNFQRKVLASGILEEVPREEEPVIEACEAPMPMMMADMEFDLAEPEVARYSSIIEI